MNICNMPIKRIAISALRLLRQDKAKIATVSQNYKTHLPWLENQDLPGIRELMLDMVEAVQTVKGMAGVVSEN